MNRERHEVFKRDCRYGHQWQEYVALFLRQNDVPAEVPKQGIVETNPRMEHSKDDQGDILCGDIIVESKGLRVTFNGPGTYPFDPVLIGTTVRYDHKVKIGKEPRVIVAVSWYTGAMMWTSVKESKGSWSREKRLDTILQRFEVSYGCPKRFWYPIDELPMTLIEAVKREEA